MSDLILHTSASNKLVWPFAKVKAKQTYLRLSLGKLQLDNATADLHTWKHRLVCAAGAYVVGPHDSWVCFERGCTGHILIVYLCILSSVCCKSNRLTYKDLRAVQLERVPSLVRRKVPG